MHPLEFVLCTALRMQARDMHMHLPHLRASKLRIAASAQARLSISRQYSNHQIGALVSVGQPVHVRLMQTAHDVEAGLKKEHV